MRKLLALLALALGVGCSSKTEEKLPEHSILIDVRTPEEYASGHLVGALPIPYDRIGGEISGPVPDRNTPILLYCRSGRRSGIARDVLLHMGYASVINLGSLEDAAVRTGRAVER